MERFGIPSIGKAFGRDSRIQTLVEELDRVVSELETVANNGKRVERPPKL